MMKNRFYLILTILCVCNLQPKTCFGQDCTCNDDLQFLIEKVEKNYFAFKNQKVVKERYKILVDSLTDIAKKNGYANCLQILRKYTDQFNDKHLVVYINEPVKDKTKIPLLFSKTETIIIKESDLLKKLNSKDIDPIEGIWIIPGTNYEIAIIADKTTNRDFVGFIRKADSLYWMPHQVKLEIKKGYNTYTTDFFARDHSVYHTSLQNFTNTSFKVQYSGTIFQKIYPPAPQSTSINQSESKETTDFGFKKLDNQTCLLTIPSFAKEYKPIIDSIIDRNRKIILSTENLIVDLRNNIGGTTPSYKKIIPFLYTNPIVKDGYSVLATEDNIAAHQEVLAYPELTEDNRKEYRKIITRLKNNKGGLVSFPGDTTKMSNIYKYPEKIGIIINELSASTTELFVLEAKQSKKVTIFGSQTMGSVHSLDVNTLSLPCGLLGLSYPLSMNNRALKIPTPSEILKADIQLPLEENKNWVELVRKHMKQISDSASKSE
ncbi:S41 family peptidase [Xanthocytophaga flava]|uniref:S41 family peptidase n=1 Tax=Xanthocytophaga flava TaxID=3048013 RepID=UPI0028D2CC28|nr:S41 family peptidase [Xanthocytophaga flavus]MDJ1470240.1 S41 family peptidase [Xanthocytophaga flavus]